MLRSTASLLVVCCATLAVAQEVEPLAGWKRRTRPLPSGLSPIGIAVRKRARLDAQTIPLAAKADWGGWAKLLQERREGEGLRAVLVRPAGPGRAMAGAWGDAVARILNGPVELLAAHRRQVDPLAQELSTFTRRKRGAEAAWRAVVDRFPGSTPAADSAQRLGERALERGQLEAAQLWWRVAESLGAAAQPQRRLWLAARPGSRDGEAGVGGRAPAPWLAWQRREPLPGGADEAPPTRAVAADAAQVYLLGARHLLALEAETGRLVWRRPRTELGAATGGLLRVGSLLVGWGPRSLRALASDDGAPRWSVTPSALLALADDPRQEVTDVVAVGAGVVALIRSGDAWCATALSSGGKVVWRTTLWPCRSESAVRNSAVIGGKVRLGSTRAVVDDGRLASLADRVFVTADGLVACLGRGRGELRWLRDRMTGFGPAARLAVRVRLDAAAEGLTALTSAGLLTRLDPLDGRDRALVRTPSAPATPLVLSTRPLVVGWKLGRALTVGVRARPVGTLAASPLWPGAALAGRLLVPLAAGLRSFDLNAGGGGGAAIPWPLGPARVVAAGGRFVLVNHAGVAVLALGSLPNPAAEVAPRDLVTGLGHRRWRVRALVRRRLLTKLLQDPSEGARIAERSRGASLEVRAAVEQVRALAARYARWRAIAPKADPAARRAVIETGRAAAVRALRPHVARTPAAATALCGELLTLPGTSARLAALDLLLRFDLLSQGRLVALVRTSADPGSKRAACDALVRLAGAGGSTRPLEVLCRWGYRSRDLTVFFSLKAAGDAALFEKVKPAELKQTLAQLRLVPGRARLAPPSGAALIRELTPWIRSRAR